ncbi:MAG: acyl-CoA dehydrogenase [Thermodesulfobacteriota bacterium]
MDFDWTPEQKDIRRRVAGLFDLAGLGEVEELETADPAGIRRLVLKWQERLAGVGYFDLGLGPAGLKDFLTLTAAQEEVSQADASLFLSVETTARLFGGLLAGWAGPELKAELWDSFKDGKLVGGVALSEPGGPEPRADWSAQARAEGGGYVLTGQKGLVTNGPLADWLAVAAAFGDRPAFFLVRPDQEGVCLGPRVPTLGYNGLAVCALELTGVKVPSARVLGPFDGDRPLAWLRMVQDMVLSVASLGVMWRSHHAANRHARSFHRGGKPIFAHQEVRFRLADTFTLYQTSQLLAYRAAWFVASGDREAPVLVNCAKVFCAESAERVASLALQILAGRGYVSGNAVERGFREAKYAGIAGTTTEVSRMNLAEEMLRRHLI